MTEQDPRTGTDDEQYTGSAGRKGDADTYPADQPEVESTKVDSTEATEQDPALTELNAYTADYSGLVAGTESESPRTDHGSDPEA